MSQLPAIILAIGAALGLTFFGKETGESIGKNVLPVVALGALAYFVLRK